MCYDSNIVNIVIVAFALFIAFAFIVLMRLDKIIKLLEKK